MNWSLSVTYDVINSFNLSSDHLQVLVLSKSEIDREDFDHEEDLKDFIIEKAKVIKDYKEVFSGWSIDSKYYVMTIET